MASSWHHLQLNLTLAMLEDVKYVCSESDVLIFDAGVSPYRYLAKMNDKVVCQIYIDVPISLRNG